MTDPNFPFPHVPPSLYHGQHVQPHQQFQFVQAPYHLISQQNIPQFMPHPSQYDHSQAQPLPYSRVQVIQLPQTPFQYPNGIPAMPQGAQVVMQSGPTNPPVPSSQPGLMHQNPNPHNPQTISYPHSVGGGVAHQPMGYHPLSTAPVNASSTYSFPQTSLPPQHPPPPPQPPQHQQLPISTNNGSSNTVLPKRTKNMLVIVDPTTGKDVISTFTEPSVPTEPQKPVVSIQENHLSRPATSEVEGNHVELDRTSCNGSPSKAGEKVEALIPDQSDEPANLVNGHVAATVVDVVHENIAPSVNDCSEELEKKKEIECTQDHLQETSSQDLEEDRAIEEEIPTSAKPVPLKPVLRYTHQELLKLRRNEASLRKPPLLPDIEYVTLANPIDISDDFYIFITRLKKGKVPYIRPSPKPSNNKYRSLPPSVPEQKIIQLPSKEEVTFREAASTFKHHFHRGNEKNEEDQLKREINGLLNKLTPENFLKISEKTKALDIKTMKDLTLLCELIFKKATREKTYASTFAKLCGVLKDSFPVPDDSTPSRTVTFRGPVIRHCQTQFETPITDYLKRAEDELDATIAAETDERTRNIIESNRTEKLKQKEDQYYGNMRFIGELIKYGVIKPVVLSYCSKQLMIESASALDCLCELYMTVGELVDKNAAKDVSPVFDFITKISQKPDLDSRLRFKLIELIELRERNWKKRELQEKLQGGPMTLSQLREKTLREQAENEETIKNIQKAARASSQRIPGGGYAHRVSVSHTMKRVDTTLLVMTAPQDISKMQFGPSNSMQNRTWAEGSRAPQQYSKRVDNDGWQDSKSGKSRVARQVSHHVSNNRSDSPITISNRYLDRQMSCMAKVASSSTTNSGRSTPNFQQQTDVTNISTPHLNLLPSSYSGGRGSTSSIPSATADDISLSTGRETPRLDLAQLERRAECNLLEYMNTNIFDVPSYEVLNSEDQLSYVEAMLSYALDKCASTKSKAGEFLERMVKEKFFSVDLIVAGLNNLFSMSDDLVTDMPNFWQYVGIILERFITDDKPNIAFFKRLKAEDEFGLGIMFARLFHLASERLGHRAVGEVFRSSLTWKSLLPSTDIPTYIKTNKLEFTINQISRLDSMTPNKLQQALRNLKNPTTEDIFDCIEEHMNPSKTLEFITVIAEYVFTYATPEGKYNFNLFLLRLPVLKKLVKEALEQDKRSQHHIEKGILNALRSLSGTDNPRQTKETIVDELESHGVIDDTVAQQLKSKL